MRVCGNPHADPRRHDRELTRVTWAGLIMFGKKKPPVSKEKELPASVESATEGSAGYPAQHRISALRERRLLTALRGVTFGLVIALMLNVIQASLLMSLMPLKEIRPFLVQVAEEGTLVAAIRPIQETFDARDLLTEKLVREYVVTRHEILRSNPVMTERWSPSGYIGTTTTPDEYRRFREQVRPVLDEIRSRDAQRRAEILAVNTVEAGRVYIVDFRSTSFDRNDRRIDEQVYAATVTVEFRSLRNLTQEQMMINPTGFTVVNYSLARKDQ